MDRFAKSDQIVMLLGAFAAVLWIKQEPDGNLLVTSVCALIGGNVSLGLWWLVKRLLGSI
jgi:prophage tail gpP-like protein